jgi:TetR/AcrR family transcriptional repressor of nem operon
MRVDQTTMAAHRAAILKQAARLFRGRGLTGVGVAEISRAAGLTHGAFYGHYTSKTALAAEALGGSLIEAAGKWRTRAAAARAMGRNPLEALVAAYLTEAHRDSAERGCALAALGPEIARAEAPLPEALRAGAQALADVLQDEIAHARPALPAAECRAASLAMLAAMTGGLVLARALAADAEASRLTLSATAELALRALPDPHPAS